MPGGAAAIPPGTFEEPAQLYVASTGNDSRTGIQPGAPLLTLAQAVTNAAGAETTVVVIDSVAVPANITLPATIRLAFAGAGKLVPASGVTVTTGPIEAGERVIFDRSGGGTVKVGVACTAWAKWWGLDTDPTALQAAMEGTVSASDVCFRGKWVTNGLDMQVATGQRDRNKRLLCLGGIRQRTGATPTVGGSIFLADNQNRDVLRVIGDDSQCGVVLDNFLIDGNKANQTSGRGLYVEQAKEMLIPRLIVQNTKDIGVQFPAGLSSNQVRVGWLYASGCDNTGIDTSGMSDGTFQYLTAGGCGGTAKAASIVIGAGNLQGNLIRIFTGTGIGLDQTGSNFKCDQIHANACGGDGVRLQGNDAYIGLIVSEENGTDTSLSTLARNGLRFSASGRNNHVGAFIGDNVGGTQQHHIRVTSTGVGNRVQAANFKTAATLKNVSIASPTVSIRGISSQSVAYAVSITINPYAGETVIVGALTGDVTFADIATDQLWNGQTIVVHVTQDATGSRTVTWGSSFAVTTPVNSAANAVTMWRLTNVGGTWRET